MQCEVAEDELASELRDGAAAIDKAAGDADAVAVIVFERAGGAGDGIDQAGGDAGATIAGGGADCAGGLIEEEVAFLHRPAVVAAERDAVDFFDRVLADVGDDE